jgi:hypothetical protein
MNGMTHWKNMGDINPKEGTSLVRDMKVEGDTFTAEVIKIIPETDVGGSDRIFDIGQGNLYLDRDDFASALKAIGREMRGSVIVAQDHNGDEYEIRPGTDEYLTELAHAVMAYSGPEYESSTLVGLGIPSVYDQEAKFPGDPLLFPQGASLWDVVKSVCDGVEVIENGTDLITPNSLQPYDDIDSPYAGTPREIHTMSDLMKIRAFAQLGADKDGNPLVWRHQYRTPDGVQEQVSAYEDCDLELEGETCLASNTSWIGPKEEDLIEAWESVSPNVEPDQSPEPGF